jgi:hypothetical protein
MKGTNEIREGETLFVEWLFRPSERFGPTSPRACLSPRLKGSCLAAFELKKK